MIGQNTIILSPLGGKTFITAAYMSYSRYLMSIQTSVHFHLATCIMKRVLNVLFNFRVAMYG